MDERGPDIDAGAITKGCLAGCGTGCAGFLLMLILFAMSGVTQQGLMQGQIPGWLILFGFVCGLGSDFVGGYVTAMASQSSPKLNATILAVITMVVSVLGYALQAYSQSNNPYAYHPSGPAAAISFLLGLISFALTLPVTLWGASIALDRQERESRRED